MKDVLPNFTSALHTEYDASCQGLGWKVFHLLGHIVNKNHCDSLPSALFLRKKMQHSPWTHKSWMIITKHPGFPNVLICWMYKLGAHLDADFYEPQLTL